MLRFWDVVAIVIFFIAMAGMGFYFARRNNSTEEYFLGNRSFPGWAVGLSMLGTSISSITFLAFPAAAYALDYRQAVQNLMLPIAAVLAVVFFIPFFRRGVSASAFEYLENRYGVIMRVYASSSFIILNVFRLMSILYLVSIPIASMTGVHIVWVILVGGFVVALYTVIGGIEAVIWTDVVQTIILLFGGLLCLGLVIFALPGGLPQVFEVGGQFHKFSLGPMDWNLSERTFLVMVLLGIINFVTEYASNQNMVQRYIAAKSLSEARKATVICSAMSIPTWLMFFFLGTCLFVFYRVFPEAEVSAMTEPERVLPHFLLTRTPPFVGGVIMAACIAAAMSSLDSSINAISTVFTVDFIKRFGRERRDEQHLKIAKRIACLAGGLMIGGAILVVYVPKESIIDLGLIIGSMLGGGMLGIFLLGFFTTRVSLKAIAVGTAIALLVNGYLMLNSLNLLPEKLALPVHSYWTTIIVNLVLVILSYVLSFCWPNRRALPGLTVWTQIRE